MKLYHFELKTLEYENYIGFDAIAPSKEKAWKIYLNQLKADPHKWPYEEVDKDMSHYYIDEYELDKEVCLPIYNCG